MKCVGIKDLYSRIARRHAKVFGFMPHFDTDPRLLSSRTSNTLDELPVIQQRAHRSENASDHGQIDDIEECSGDREPLLLENDIVLFQCDVEAFDLLSTPLELMSDDNLEHCVVVESAIDDVNFSDTSSIMSLAVHDTVCHDQELSTAYRVDMYDTNQTLASRESISSNSSLSQSDDDDDDEALKHNLMLKLRAFAKEAHVSRRHMNTLLEILRLHGVANFPFDYRTLLKECLTLDALSQRVDPFAQPNTVQLILVCGKCWLTRFDEVAIQNARICSHCNVSTMRCPRSMCNAKCVLTASLHAGSMSSLTYCYFCEVGCESQVARRTFRFPLANYLKTAFANIHFVHSAMTPFKGFCELIESPNSGTCSLHCVPDWYNGWKSSLEARSVASEFWDGKLFRDNPLWEVHGPRSLLLVISLDWFPPFKQRDYSVGVLTLSPANLSSADRAKRVNTWVIAIIEGPNEPAHVHECLRPCFEEIRDIALRGVEVFDVGTMSRLIVHVTAPVVSADVPACAKLGNLYGHSSYFPCVSCEYKGAVCGCKPSKNNSAIPARWDNRSFRPASGNARVLLSGDATRKLNKGEHLAFIDSEVLLPHHSRLESVHRAGILSITKSLEKETNQALVDRLRKKVRSNGPSPLSILDSSHFSFTNGFSIDAMHTVLKGVILKLWIATVGDKYQKKWYNVQYYDGGLKVLKYRLAKFLFPIGFPSANKFVKRRHALKAEELYTILRVCGPFVFNNIVPKSVVEVWVLFTKLFTNLLHYHVSKAWMNSSSGLRPLLKEAFEKYHAVFGPCLMPSNFHRVLHCWLDFRNWGPLRCHWAFPYERLYGSLCATSRMQNRAQVTMSIVNSINLIYATASDANSDEPGRILKIIPEHVDVQALDVCTLLSAGYVWVKTLNVAHSRRWHTNEYLVSLSAGCTVSADCFFLIVGILCHPSIIRNKAALSSSSNKPSNNSVLVLRSLKGLRSRQVFPNSATFFSVNKESVTSNNHIGTQSLYSTSTLLNSNNAICPVVQYNLNYDHIILIPSFGLVDWR